MKKSKVIIPALGVLILSTAASVTGTVAWFTANRTAQINVGEFAVVNTSSNLNYEVAAGHGTFLIDAETDYISLDNAASSPTGKTVLSDGSFDHLTGSHDIYTPNAAGDKIGKKVALASATDNEAATGLVRGSTGAGTTVSPTVKVYTAVTWTITFKVTFGASGGDVALMMDHTANHSQVQYWTGSAWSAFAATDGTETGNDLQNKTARGFRIAFIPTDTTNGVTRVWADGEISTACKYVSNQSIGTALNVAGCNTAYTTPYLIDQTVGSALPDDGSAQSVFDARNDYLGKIPFSANAEVEAEYTCVAWFEGSDRFIINQNAIAGYQKVKAQMDFAIVNIGA